MVGWGRLAGVPAAVVFVARWDGGELVRYAEEEEGLSAKKRDRSSERGMVGECELIDKKKDRIDCALYSVRSMLYVLYGMNL